MGAAGLRENTINHLPKEEMTMKGTKTLGFFLAIFIFLIFPMGLALAQSTFTMKMATVWSTDDTATNKCLNYLKPRIEQLTKGRVKVELRKGTLGGERDMYEGVQLGTIESACLTTGTLGGFVPLAEIFMVPYLFKDWNHAYASVSGPFGEHLNKLMLARGMRNLAWWSCGGREIYGKGEPIPTTPDLLKGKKIRVMETPFLVELYKHYGALPTPMAFPEVYTALQQGVIDGVQAGLSTYASGHHEVSKWIVIIRENATLMTFVVSEKWWSKLPDELKGEVYQAIQEGTVINHVLDEREEALTEKKWGAAGVKVVYGNREAFQAKARELYPKFAQRLGGDQWLKWIEEVGKAFPVEQYPSIKEYKMKYNF